MCDIQSVCSAGWAETLPDGCPAECLTRTNARAESLYRLVNQPPTEADFLSVQGLNPEKHYAAESCKARALSMWRSRAKCATFAKAPRHRGKSVAAVQLNLGAGVIDERNDGHVSWWRCRAFEVLNVTTVVE